jgi:hypothetical protein
VIEAVVLAAAATATFPATWWLLGRLDNSGAWIIDPDYAVQPPQFERGLTHLVGAGSVAVVMLVITAAVVMTMQGRWRLCVAGVLLPWLAGFAYAGMAGHVMTTPVIGANIGAGLVLMGAVPVGIGLVSLMAVSLKACWR